MVDKVALKLQYRLLGGAASLCANLAQGAPGKLESSGLGSHGILRDFHHSYCDGGTEADEYSRYSLEEGLEIFGNPEIGGIPLRGENIGGFRSAHMDELRVRRGPFDEIRALGRPELLELIPPRVREVGEMLNANPQFQRRLAPWLSKLRDERRREGVERWGDSQGSPVETARHSFERAVSDCGLGSAPYETRNQLVALVATFGDYKLLVSLDLSRLESAATTTTGQRGRVELLVALVRGSYIPPSRAVNVDSIPLRYEALVPNFQMAYRDWWTTSDLAGAIYAKIILLQCLDYFAPAFEMWRGELGGQAVRR